MQLGQCDPFKIQTNILVSRIGLSLTPQVLYDMMKFNTFMEMFSYADELRRYKPLYRIQSFIDKQPLSVQQQRRKKIIIR